MDNVVRLPVHQDIKSFRLLRRAVWESILSNQASLLLYARDGISLSEVEHFVSDKIREVNMSLERDLPLSQEEFQLMHETGFEITGTRQ